LNIISIAVLDWISNYIIDFLSIKVKATLLKK